MQPPNVHLTIDDAAALADVSPSTVRNWIKAGKIGCERVDGIYRMDPVAFRCAKVLREKQMLGSRWLRDLDVRPEDLVHAIQAGAVVPSSGAPRCFSLDDVSNLIAFKKGEWNGLVPAPPMGVATGAEAPQEEPVPAFEEESDEPGASPKKLEPVDTFAETVGSARWKALVEYITVHKDPFKLPATFWDSRTCPEFIPPAGVFRFVYGKLFEIDDLGNPGTGIKRSEGWWWDAERQALHLAREDETHACEEGIRWPPGAEPSDYAVQNLRWRNLRRDWQDAWRARRQELRAAGIETMALPELETPGRRNRRVLLERYREEHWSPCDLPDWFWDTDECPPFEPPPGITRFTYGEHAPDPNGSGRLGTWIGRAGMWQHPIGEAPWFDPADEHFEWVPGEFEEGTPATRYEDANRQYELAHLEWQQEFRIRQQHRRGER